jgi:hypothetical protein
MRSFPPRHGWLRGIFGALLLTGAMGCGSSNSGDLLDDAGAVDAGGADAGVQPDAGALTGADAGPADAGSTDAGVQDAGSPDAGQTVPDAGSSVPSLPIAFNKDAPFTISSGTTNWVFVPDAYDSTHHTPITLFVWLHGCGGQSSGDIYTVSPAGSAQTWISLAVGGREGDCWDVNADPSRVLSAIAELKTHFNIKPRGVILGGYSSGGDLAYKVAFYNAAQFAGLLVENTSPFRDTGSTKASSLAAAAWKFNVVHLAHLQDTTYPIAGVRTETDAMKSAGFPLTRLEVDGTHYDAPGAMVNGHAVPGTTADVATYLFPKLSAGWTAP